MVRFSSCRQTEARIAGLPVGRPAVRGVGVALGPVVEWETALRARDEEASGGSVRGPGNGGLVDVTAFSHGSSCQAG